MTINKAKQCVWASRRLYETALAIYDDAAGSLFRLRRRWIELPVRQKLHDALGVFGHLRAARILIQRTTRSFPNPNAIPWDQLEEDHEVVRANLVYTGKHAFDLETRIEAKEQEVAGYLQSFHARQHALFVRLWLAGCGVSALAGAALSWWLLLLFGH